MRDLVLLFLVYFILLGLLCLVGCASQPELKPLPPQTQATHVSIPEVKPQPNGKCLSCEPIIDACQKAHMADNEALAQCVDENKALEKKAEGGFSLFRFELPEWLMPTLTFVLGIVIGHGIAK